MDAHPRLDRGHRQFVARDSPLLEQQASDRDIRQTVLPVIADANHRPVLQTYPPGTLDLQKERVDRVFNPEQFEAATGEGAILDLRPRIPRTRAEIGRAPVDWRLVLPVRMARPVQLDFEIAGEQAFVVAIIAHRHRRERAFQKPTGRRLVVCRRRGSLPADRQPIFDPPVVDAAVNRTERQLFRLLRESRAGFEKDRQYGGEIGAVPTR